MVSGTSASVNVRFSSDMIGSKSNDKWHILLVWCGPAESVRAAISHSSPFRVAKLPGLLRVMQRLGAMLVEILVEAEQRWCLRVCVEGASVSDVPPVRPAALVPACA